MASPSETQEFLGKSVVVTGSNSGIGRAIALHFALRGASVTLCGRDLGRLQDVLHECIKVSGDYTDRFLTVAGDVNEVKVRTDIVEGAVSKFGKLDILVCNAGGIDSRDGLLDATEDSFDFHMNVLVKSIFFIIQAATPHLEKSKGNIIATSSVSSKLTSPSVVLYSTAKAALDHMLRCLAVGLAPKGIRVNTINPSYTTTNIIREGTDEENHAKDQRIIKNATPKQPLENRMVTLDEIVEAAAFLASDRASFITGQNLFVDGGRALLGPTTSAFH